MRPSPSLILLFLALLCPAAAVAQHYRVVGYDVNSGLASDVVKAITIDTMGYIWLGIDEGVIRFDGRRSQFFANANPGDYVKRFYRTADGQMWVVKDLGIERVRPQGDSFAFETLWEGSHRPQEILPRKVHYPKDIFQASDGAYWISEPHTVVRVTPDSFQRFDMGIENVSRHFGFSFIVRETQDGDLLLFSHLGKLWKYNPRNGHFEPQDWRIAGHGLNSILEVEPGRFWLATNDGLFETLLGPEGGLSPPRLLRRGAYIEAVGGPQGKVFVGEMNEGVFESDREARSFRLLASTSVNDLFLQGENLWVATNNGIKLLQPTFFRPALFDEGILEAKGSYNYVQSIKESGDKVYFSLGSVVFSIDGRTDELDTLAVWPEGFIAQIEPSPQGLWLIDEAGNIYLRDTAGRIERLFDNMNRFANAARVDSAGWLWVAFKDFGGLHGYAPDLSQRRAQPQGGEVFFNCLRPDGQGGFFCGAFGTRGYLYHFDPAQGRFEDLSVPVEMALMVNDLDLAADGSLYLATSSGIQRLRDGRLEELPTYAERVSFRSIGVAADGSVWTASNFELLRISPEGNITRFNQAHGLASNTGVPRCLLEDRFRHVWVGSPSGLSRSVGKVDRSLPTPAPLLARLDQARASRDGQWLIQHGSALVLSLAVLDFPNNRTQFRYRVAPGDGAWRPCEDRLVVDGLDEGAYALEVQALQEGRIYQWSPSSSASFRVVPPWYRTWAFLLAAAALLALATFLLFRWRTYKLKREKDLLEAIVQKRTAEIKAQKEEIAAQARDLYEANQEILAKNDNLETLNHEQKSLMGIVAHDLKSPLNNVIQLLELIEMSGDLNPKQNRFKNLIITVLEGGRRLIQDLLDITAIEGHQTPMELQPFVLAENLEPLLSGHFQAAEKKNIRMELVFEGDCGQDILTDLNFLGRVLDNLVSNALKFSEPGGTVRVKTRCMGEQWVLSVKDDGPGFTDDDRRHLFKKFKKLSARPTAGEHSSGLGLSIVKTLVEQLQGRIALESQPGQGSEFILSFPRKPKANP